MRDRSRGTEPRELMNRAFPARRLFLKPASLARWAAMAAIALIFELAPAKSRGADPASSQQLLASLNQLYPTLEELYRHLHAHPELSYAEKETASRMAQELTRTGFEVTTGVGGYGVVGVLRNGTGPTLLIRTDMDALPVEEKTGLPYASTVSVNDGEGGNVRVMHACGHDIHMSVWVGTARMLAEYKDNWKGTLIMIAQPAEERGGGARMMLKAGLFERFPLPQACLALHVGPEYPAGTVALVEGYAMANVDMLDVTIRGVGGHGAYPHTAKDPVVVAAQAILAYQTIVSREVEPGQAAVVTVGSVRGGTKHNVIPDQVDLQLTLRSYTDAVRSNTLASVQRITHSLALAAGMPTNRLPEFRLRDESLSALYNDPAITGRLRTALSASLGAERVLTAKPVMGGEDFSEYGRTAHRIPICLFWLGATDPRQLEERRKGGAAVPPLHSSRFAPPPEASIQTGVLAMTTAVMELARDLPPPK